MTHAHVSPATQAALSPGQADNQFGPDNGQKHIRSSASDDVQLLHHCCFVTQTRERNDSYKLSLGTVELPKYISSFSSLLFRSQLIRCFLAFCNSHSN